MACAYTAETLIPVVGSTQGAILRILKNIFASPVQCAFSAAGAAGESGPGWPSSSAASAQNWRSSAFLGSFASVHATAWSNHLRASYLSPFCQRAMATKNQSWALPPFCRAIEFAQSIIDSVQCPERYSSSASVFR